MRRRAPLALRQEEMIEQNESEESLRPALYVVATPLGNLGDLSPRAFHVLSAADVVLAEDTRRSGQLFHRLGIPAHGFVSFHEHNEDARTAHVIETLQEGKSVALISDAGTPLMSDPGFTLVRECRREGLDVVPVPGASAPLTALSASGIPPLPFTFLGFLPRKVSEQKRLFATHGATGATLVFFERKNRLMESLALAHECLGARDVCVCRELTKAHEDFINGNLAELDSLEVPLLGEFTIVVGPPSKNERATQDEVCALLEREREAGGKPRQLARRVADQVQGWSSKDVYALLNSL
ncbi:16S rRNA (cytidine1402-2'-O)-methyltransferase [Desulfobaculum bizertense DSM 18034]|uniref:Ribosomal RNA small subunit methyltransferase I n=2 Tax=Desulfobaculum TaxID=1433996 RepID=A0A1T4VI03_9BACT|nr:16S rRNA (cytidine1402-2'-O)-methyltransferase [Desulfobaculum bizertense DSM 18034]